MNQKSTYLILSIVVVLYLTSCIAGPAFPEENGRKYLKRRRYETSFIDKVVDGGVLSHKEIIDLSESKSPDVRYLVARNGNLTSDEIDIFIEDEHFFVRSGAARNPSLSNEQIDLLTTDVSHTVYCQLAVNPSLSDKQLLIIQKERGLELSWFAMNPNCPESILEEIRNSDDTSALEWLESVEYWKNSGYFIQDENGRWYKS